jgi:hypothetical protein
LSDGLNHSISGRWPRCFVLRNGWWGSEAEEFRRSFCRSPSVALATISLTVLKKGTGYAAMEAQSMILGAIAFLIYAWLVSRALFRRNFLVLPTTSIGLVAWIALALALRLLI